MVLSSFKQPKGYTTFLNLLNTLSLGITNMSFSSSIFGGWGHTHQPDVFERSSNAYLITLFTHHGKTLKISTILLSTHNHLHVILAHQKRNSIVCVCASRPVCLFLAHARRLTQPTSTDTTVVIIVRASHLKMAPSHWLKRPRKRAHIGGACERAHLACNASRIANVTPLYFNFTLH